MKFQAEKLTVYRHLTQALRSNCAQCHAPEHTQDIHSLTRPVSTALHRGVSRPLSHGFPHFVHQKAEAQFNDLFRGFTRDSRRCRIAAREQARWNPALSGLGQDGLVNKPRGRNQK
jgi:hypothetical protein